MHLYTNIFYNICKYMQILLYTNKYFINLCIISECIYIFAYRKISVAKCIGKMLEQVLKSLLLDFSESSIRLHRCHLQE